MEVCSGRGPGDRPRRRGGLAGGSLWRRGHLPEKENAGQGEPGRRGGVILAQLESIGGPLRTAHASGAPGSQTGLGW